MNRRGFLGALFGAAALAMDPDRLLWLPGKKLISIPAAPILAPEDLGSYTVTVETEPDFLSTHKIVYETLRVLKNNLAVWSDPEFLQWPESNRSGITLGRLLQLRTPLRVRLAEQ